jgi:outer membrane protein TolC
MLAEKLRRAEERKLSLGLSNLIDVNIRELQAASAAQALIEAQAGYFLALADYEAAAAHPPSPLDTEGASNI